MSNGERGDGGSSRFLSPAQIAMIDEALSKLGPFGEVRLVVQNGRVRFLVTQKSIDALRWEKEISAHEGT